MSIEGSRIRRRLVSKSSLTHEKKKFHVDYTLVVILILMTLSSMIAIFGSLPLLPQWKNGVELLVKQGLWYLIGYGFLIFLIFFGIDRLFTGIRVFYWILLGLLILLLLDKLIDLPFISPVNGTRAWFNLPGIGSIQPSEFMKIVLVIMTANVVHEHNQSKTEMSFASDFKLFFRIAKFALLPILLIILQPDTGIPIIIIIGILSMLAIGGVRREWVWIGGFGLVAGLATLVLLFYVNPDLLSKVIGGGYKLNRFYGWLQTEKFISSWGSQLYQGMLAIGSGGWFGHGLASKLVTILEPQNDFIFAVIGQNFGFLGTTAILVMSLALDIKLALIALDYKEPRERYMVAGLLGMILFQQIQNMGMIIGLLPITGITLPLISAGGSSLLSYMLPFAIIFHMSSENKNRRIH
jgi:rod shape determining protein RodA